MDLAKTIRVRREEMGMTQAALALRSGVSRQSIVALEATGECRVSSLRRIAQVLKLDFSLLPQEAKTSASAREKRSWMPVPGERPNIWQQMNRVRELERRRAEIVRAAVADLKGEDCGSGSFCQ